MPWRLSHKQLCSWSLRPRHRQSQVPLERLVSLRGVEQRVALVDAEGGQAALGGADGEAAGLQGVVVDGGLLGEVETGELDAPEEAERLLRLTAVELVGEAVEDLGQRLVRHREGGPAEEGVQVSRRGRGRSREVGDPGGGVNENLHGSLPGCRPRPPSTPACRAAISPAPARGAARRRAAPPRTSPSWSLGRKAATPS